MAEPAAPATLRDRDGIQWVRFADARGQRTPRYSAPWNNGEIVRRGVIEPFMQRNHCVVCVPLPYFAVPMWPARFYPKMGWAGFTYRFCGVCNRALRGRCRLAVQFVVGLGARRPQLAITVAARLLCPECSAQLPARPDTEGLSRYPYVVFATNDVRLALHTAIEEFASQIRYPEGYCSMCSVPDIPFSRERPLCGKRACRRAASILSAIGRNGDCPEKEDATLMVLLLLRHLQERRINIVRPLAWHRCGQKGCTRAANPDLPCKRCTRVLYCSKRCRAIAATLHRRGCFPWLAVWDPRSLVFVQSPRCP